jgi:hypothetical protein
MKDENKRKRMKQLADSPVENLALAVEQNSRAIMHIDSRVQHGVISEPRHIINMDMLKQELKHPTDASGAAVKVTTRENYKIYSCLRSMPHCIRSMEISRGDKDGKIGHEMPLKDTICVAVHHLDDKTYGGLCVLREWGATEMVTIFVGYNPLQSKIWRSMLDDIPDELFNTCILETVPNGKDAPTWAEGIYRVAKDFNKFPNTVSFPSEAFDKIFDGTDTEKNPEGKPLSFLYAQRSLCAYNFLRAIAKGRKENKKVFVWEDGGYLNPIIDQAIEDKLTVSQFRSLHMLPKDEETDGQLPEQMSEALEGVFVGTVELTRNGYDMSASIAAARKMNTRFFSIAASYEKVMLEGDSITLACLDALSQVLYSTGSSLRNRNVLVMGARGNLGRLSVGHLANILENSEKQLWGCDLKLNWPKSVPGSIPEWATWSACDVPLPDVAGEVAAYDDLPESVRCDLDVIFGWTGGPRKITADGREIEYKTVSGQNIADWLTKGTNKSNLYLVSGSTKTIEFSDVLTWLESLLNSAPNDRKINNIPLRELKVDAIPDQLSIAAVQQMWPDDNPPSVIKRNFGTQFTFVFEQNGEQVEKTLYLVNNTMPINFMYYGTPTEIMDMTYSQVTSCAAALFRNQDIEPGIYPTDYKKKATDGVYLGRELAEDYEIPYPFSIAKEKNEFTGAVDVYRSYFGCINTMINKLGAEKVLAIMSESDEQRGIKVGQEIRASAGGKDFDIPKALHTIIDMASDIGGQDTIIDESDMHAATVTKFGKCPVYEGAKALGMDDSEIEKLCRASSLVFLNAVVKQLNPKLKYIVSAFRSEEYGGCVEEIVLDE